MSCLSLLKDTATMLAEDMVMNGRAAAAVLVGFAERQKKEKKDMQVVR